MHSQRPSGGWAEQKGEWLPHGGPACYLIRSLFTTHLISVLPGVASPSSAHSPSPLLPLGFRVLICPLCSHVLILRAAFCPLQMLVIQIRNQNAKGSIVTNNMIFFRANSQALDKPSQRASSQTFWRNGYPGFQM